jgi:hypothetical protein
MTTAGRCIATYSIILAACSFARPPDVADVADAAEGGGPVGAADAGQHPMADAPGTSPRCDPTKPFGTPTPVEHVNSTLDEVSFTLTADETQAFVTRYAGMGSTDAKTLLATRRSSNEAAFETPTASSTSTINAAGDVWGASSGSDGLTLYFYRFVNATSFFVFVASRASTDSKFDAGTVVKVDGSDLSGSWGPLISADGGTLYWGDESFSNVSSATRAASAGNFLHKRAVADLVGYQDLVLSADELTLYSNRLGNGSDTEVIASSRADKTGTFANQADVGGVNAAGVDIPVALTNDGCVLYISSDRPGGVGGRDIWQARRPK